MTAAAEIPSMLEWAKDVGLPVIGFVAGFLTSRWTLTKKDRKDLEQKNFENTSKLIEQHDQAYDSYTKAIAAYAAAPTADAANFLEIATRGDRYFYQLNLMSAGILSDKVDSQLREDVLLRKVREAVARTLPQHYQTLSDIANKHGFPYSGELRRADYSAIYGVVDKYGAGPRWSEEPDQPN